jgi:hypothetical protein
MSDEARLGSAQLDVSTEEDYADGHPKGALNVPFELATRKGTEKNADFLRVIERVFEKDAQLRIVAKEADWAERATSLLRAAGYANVTVAAGSDRSETITDGGSYPEMRWRAGIG